MEHPTVTTVIEWHRLIDGDPPSTGWYIVGHRGSSKLIIFNKVLYPNKNTPKTGPNAHGWREDVSWATHWAKMPYAPSDRTPQLFTAEGQTARQENDYAKALDGQAKAVQAIEYDSRGMPAIMWDK